MDVGSHDRLITVWAAALVDDGFAERPGALVEQFAVWAKKMDVSDAERLRSGMNAAEMTTRFRVRRDVDTARITPAMELRYEGVAYDIVGIKETEGRAGLEISARARVPV